MAKIYTIPNIITFVRIILIPIILYLLFSDNSKVVLVAGLLFIVSSISDYFDGYLARTLNQSSKLGTLLDPIADKLLIAAVIIVLIDTRVIADIHVIPAIIILLREIAISGLREFLAKLNTDMPVSKLAKYKTTFQMVSLSILIISLGFELNQTISFKELKNNLISKDPVFQEIFEDNSVKYFLNLTEIDDDNQTLNNGDILAFLPPVTGG